MCMCVLWNKCTRNVIGRINVASTIVVARSDIALIHLDNGEVQADNGRICLVVVIDRTSKSPWPTVQPLAR